MPVEVDVPNVGTISFPDEMSQDDISSVLAKQFPKIQSQPSASASLTGEEVPPPEDQSFDASEALKNFAQRQAEQEGFRQFTSGDTAFTQALAQGFMPGLKPDSSAAEILSSAAGIPFQAAGQVAAPLLRFGLRNREYLGGPGGMALEYLAKKITPEQSTAGQILGQLPPPGIDRTERFGGKSYDPYEEIIQPGKPIIKLPKTGFEEAGLESNPLKNLVEGFLTPENIALFPFAASKPVQALFLTQTVPGAITAAEKLFDPDLPAKQRKDAATEMLINAAFSYGLAHGLTKDLALPTKTSEAPSATASPEVPAMIPIDVKPKSEEPAGKWMPPAGLSLGVWEQLTPSERGAIRNKAIGREPAPTSPPETPSLTPIPKTEPVTELQPATREQLFDAADARIAELEYKKRIKTITFDESMQLGLLRKIKDDPQAIADNYGFRLQKPITEPLTQGEPNAETMRGDTGQLPTSGEVAPRSEEISRNDLEQKPSEPNQPMAERTQAAPETVSELPKPSIPAEELKVSPAEPISKQPSVQFEGTVHSDWPYGLVSPDPTGKGWRFTWFGEFEGEKQPYGHEVYPTREAAMAAAKELNYKPSVSEPVSKPTPEPTLAENATVEPAVVPEKAKVGKVVKSKGIERPWDIIDEIQSRGTIRTKSKANPGTEGYYTSAYDELRGSSARKVFSETGQSWDEMLDALRRDGVMGEDATVDDLQSAMQNAVTARGAHFRGESPEAKLDKFTKSFQAALKQKKSQIISVGDLSVGETFYLDNEEFRVTAIDPDTGDVHVSDGKKFGAQTIPDGSDVPVEKGTYKPVEQSTEFVPKQEAPPLELAKPETIEEQKLRLAREAEARKPKPLTDAEKLQQKQQQRLTGNSGDIGQTDLLAPPQDLWAGSKIGQGPGAKTARESARPESPETAEGTGLKHAIDELERVSYGFGERPRQEKQAMAEAWVRAGERLAANPLSGVQLADELINNPKRALSGDESALILRHKVALENAINNASEKAFTGTPEEKISSRLDLAAATDSLKLLMDAVNRRGSEWGREGRWRQAIAYEDYTFAAQERLATAAKGSPLTDSERAKLQADVEEHKAAADAYEKHITEKDAKIAEMEVNAALHQIELENAKAPKYSPGVLAQAEKFASYMDKKGNEALARIKARHARTLAGIDPTELVDLSIYGASKITRGLTDFAKWSAHMAEAVGDWVKPHLNDIWKASQKNLDDELKNQVVFIKKSSGEKTGESVRNAVKDMTSGERQADLKTKIENKVKDKKENEITPFVQKIARTFVEQGIRDRDALIDTVHGVLQDIMPDFTRRQTMDAISGYGAFKQLSKDEISVALRDLKGQMQQVAKIEDMAAGQAPIKTGIERRSPSDAERDFIKMVNEAKKKGGYDVTDPDTQLASAESTRLTTLRNRITDLQNEIQSGERLIKQRGEPVTSPEIEALKSQLESVKAEHASVFKTALESFKRRTEKRIADMEQRITDENFSPRPKKPGPALDKEANELLVKKLRVEQRFEDARRSWELKNRTGAEKVADFFGGWRRSFVLSSPVSLAKLAAAATEGLMFEPAKEMAGKIISAPFPRFEGRTSVESNSSVKIEANSIKQAFMRTLDDAAQTLKTGKSDLEVAFGGHRPVPEEMVSYFGRLHAAIKTPLKRAVFERVYGKLTELAIRAGKDVTDPMAQIEMGTIAMKEANRALFLEDNMLVQAYQRALSRFSQADKTTGEVPTTAAVSGGLARVLLPIVRIPTNLVARTVQAAVGFPVGATKLAIAYAKGIEKLPTEQADLIKRQLKQGSIGGAFLLAGFFLPDVFGGYYQKHEKRGPNTAKIASIKIGDYNVPSFLLHHPLLEVMQLGATIRRVMDSKLRKRDLHTQGPAAGALAGAIGLAEEVPFGREIVDLAEFTDPDTRQNAIAKQIAGMTEPQALQWLARQLDKKIPFDPREDPVKRKPVGMWQNMKMGIPGLRQTVPTGQKISP